MDMRASLLALPPEIRELILFHLFDQSRLIHLRCPKHCRLRASRTDKDDASGVLSTCRLLRHEAAPVFLSVNVVRFRHSSDILEFLGDPRVSDIIKENITRIVVDDGDIMDLAALKATQMNALRVFTAMPRLRVLEFRAWARTDNAHYLANLNHLAGHWNLLKVASEASGDHHCLAEGDPDGDALDPLRSARLCVTIHESQEKYSTSTDSTPGQTGPGRPNNDVNLKVCNLVLSKNTNEQPILSGAKEAVAQRMKVAGATHIKDDNVLERLTWGADELPWIDMNNPRPLGERYH